MNNKTKEFTEKVINGEIDMDKFNEHLKELSDDTFSFKKLKINVKNESNNETPKYAKDGDSGFDLRANLPNGDITLKPLERFIVPTGLFFELPTGFDMEIRPRSGLAAKNGVTVLNTPGTVDCGYRGEIKIILINLSNEDFVIKHGERIAQAVIAPVSNGNVLELVSVTDIDTDTNRGDNGFGSTGLK